MLATNPPSHSPPISYHCWPPLLPLAPQHKKLMLVTTNVFSLANVYTYAALTVVHQHVCGPLVPRLDCCLYPLQHQPYVRKHTTWGSVEKNLRPHTQTRRHADGTIQYTCTTKLTSTSCRTRNILSERPSEKNLNRAPLPALHASSVQKRYHVSFHMYMYICRQFTQPHALVYCNHILD